MNPIGVPNTFFDKFVGGAFDIALAFSHAVVKLSDKASVSFDAIIRNCIVTPLNTKFAGSKENALFKFAKVKFILADFQSFEPVAKDHLRVK